MKQIKISTKIFTFLAVAMAAVSMIPQTTYAATSSQIREAQTIMTKFGLPTGPIDGLMGPQTQRGLCAFRYISGMTVTRSATIDSILLSKLRQHSSNYSSLKQISDLKTYNGEYMVAEKTCQVMFHIINGKFSKVMPISSGNPDVGIETPNKPRNADRSYFILGNTQRGWHCSTQYPESCRTETAGEFAYISDYGNMYNMRWMNDGGLYVHGSMRVPTYPGSAGCIRVTPADSDWMWNNVGNNGSIRLYVEGMYN
jgi:hypothetical protein